MPLLWTLLGISVDSTQSRKGIRQYKYTSPPLSVCEKLFLNGFWDRVAQQFPLWVAPNVITLLGGMFILVGTIALLIYSPCLKGTAPSWVYFLNAFCLFMYQTCDGSDGKQARRTGAGSPLGHLFDHGLDSVVTSLVATWAADVFGQGTGHILFPIFVSLGQLAFFLSNLVCVHKGSQLFYPVDVQEFLLTMMLALILKGLFGTKLWQIPAGPGGYTMPLWLWIAVLSICSILNNTARYIWNTLTPYAMGTAPAGRRIEGAVGHILTAAIHSLLVFWNLWHIPSILHPSYIAVLVSFSGLTMSLLMVVIAANPFPILHWAIPIQLLMLPDWQDPAIDWAIATAAVICYVHYARQVIIVITQELNIHVFRIKARCEVSSMAEQPSNDAKGNPALVCNASDCYFTPGVEQLHEETSDAQDDGQLV